MAGDWIKMRADLFDHPKVVRISSALEADILRTVGALMSVWCLFDKHSLDGSLDYTAEALDLRLRWPGFADQMAKVGWLVVGPEKILLPEFDTHNGASAKRRAQDALRKQNVRMLSAIEADTPRTNGRLEKRREEKKEEAKASGEQRPADASPPAALLPLVDGSEFAVTRAMAMEFAQAYPALHVGEQLQAMRAWLLSNPKNRKTASGIMRFVNAWLSRSQNNAHRVVSQAAQQTMRVVDADAGPEAWR
jgi:hypothetical protein